MEQEGLGSSPLARGTPPPGSDGVITIGLIPARAGNTSITRSARSSNGAHPRSRGEHDPIPSHTGRMTGSSPLARGTLRRVLARTPQGGSSPLARGTQEHITGQCLVRGLIPARAGNTTFLGVTNGPGWAHPRSRGEHSLATSDPHVVAGSSPLARGTHGIGCTLEKRRGLIPARAGNTASASYTAEPCRAHPRSRGEHAGTFQTKSRETGSSPLARGTRCRGNREGVVVGLIPARAGNTLLHKKNANAYRAHPRSRGEHRKQLTISTLITGSSPLARGTHD